jgi:RNA polymerase sigma-70 factor, ECF subfamily
MIDVRSATEAVFRRESGRIIANLIRISGSFDRAEEAMQESFASALSSWPVKGIPENPGAWIMTAAHRKLNGPTRSVSARIWILRAGVCVEVIQPALRERSRHGIAENSRSSRDFYFQARYDNGHYRHTLP